METKLVADVSLAMLFLTVKEQTTREELNKYLCDSALSGPLQNQIDYQVCIARPFQLHY